MMEQWQWVWLLIICMGIVDPLDQFRTVLDH
ncbi:unnamed protein product [Notodromas monacha]|uniref:Uncharacterized protein n=1 Tax=Notodromas monacha TaxID=399045 RepID=A0A7R9GMJ0_9CRUS|nr:unnamed protein product [Notodromas monacha]CAG0926146.1 unnamed protein product [Notodromas monacha]